VSAGGPGYEPADVAPRPVLVIAGVVAAVLVLVLLVNYGLRAWFSGPGPARPGVEAKAPEPHLQPRPEADLHALRSQKRRALETYGWVDRRAGVVHIPIERAMALSVQRRAAQRRNRR
jgi:hypothetical protein